MMMKTKADLQKEIDALADVAGDIKNQLARLQNDLRNISEKAEEKPWPQTGDLFEFIAANGEIVPSIWDGGNYDNEIKDFYNIFKPGTAAKELAYLKFERAVRAKAKELNGDWVADWSDATQCKYIIEIQPHSVDVGVEDYLEVYSTIIRGMECKSEEAAQALLDHFGAEKFLAYATGGEL